MISNKPAISEHSVPAEMFEKKIHMMSSRDIEEFNKLIERAKHKARKDFNE